MPRGKDEPKALGELGAKPFRGGEENRAKDAKDAKVKGMEDGEIVRVVGGGGFALDKELGAGGWGLGLRESVDEVLLADALARVRRQQVLTDLRLANLRNC